MIGAGMIRREREGARELRSDLRRPRPRRAVGAPPVIGVQVHQRFGGERRDVGIPRIGACERAHALGVRVLVDCAGSRVPYRQCLDERARCGRGARRKRDRAGQRGPNASLRTRIHVGVDAGPERPRESPVAERAAGIDRDRGFERTRGFRGIEAPDQHDALMEVALRDRRTACHRPAIGTHAVEERCDRVAGARRSGRDRHCGSEQQRVCDESSRPPRAALSWPGSNESSGDLVRALLCDPGHSKRAHDG